MSYNFGRGRQEKQLKYLKNKLNKTYREIFDIVKQKTWGSLDDCEAVILKVGYYWCGHDFPEKFHQIVFDYLTFLLHAVQNPDSPHAKVFTSEQIEDFSRKLRYREYLESGKWQLVRERALTRAGRRCVLCSSIENLQVHHNTYENFGNEKDADVTVLCDRCHQRFHNDRPFWV